jgi:lipopolysaccharide/colanic/teichoic acid biosynthesis glycosyltransferase
VSDQRKMLERIWLFLMRMALFVCLFLAFFWTFSIGYPWILRLSRTAAVTMVTFAVAEICLQSIYGGFAVGKQRSKAIINNLILATGMTDVVTYIQLSIMNTNSRFNSEFHLANAWLLLASFLLQLFIITIFAYGGNEIYFHFTPPEACIIVTTSQYSLNKIVPKIQRYGKQYQIVDVVDYSSIQVYDRILACDTVFLYDIPVGERARLIEYCYDNHKNIYYNLELSDVVALGAQHVMLEDKSLICAPIKEMPLEQRFLKRAMDLMLSIPALIVASPVMLGCVIAIKACDHGPVLFLQERATRDGKVFQVYKFRTMTVHDPKAPQQSAKTNDARITPVGKYLRKFRLDELPQLINIIKGEMSLVGPRPEMMENVYRYTKQLPQFEYRLRVKAGLTGLAQVYGKYNTSPKDKLILDLIYIQKYHIWLDIKLLMQTLLIFLKSSDSTEGFSEEETIIEFKRFDH